MRLQTIPNGVLNWLQIYLLPMTAMPTTLEKDAEKFAEFIIKNYPDAKEWQEPVAQAAWYINFGLIAAVLDDKGRSWQS
jgi:hypothetical protein